MAAPKGNNFWRLRSSKPGPKAVFATPEILWDQCCEWFDIMEEHPLYEEKAFSTQGEVITTNLRKARPFTLGRLLLFLDISDFTWSTYKKKDDFHGVITRVESIIYAQKFEGAAAELMNPNIIARDLGLRDRQDHDVSVTLEDLILKSNESS